MQGTPINLDELIARRLLLPRPVTLGGRTFQVRTDLTGAEVAEFLSLNGRGMAAAALTILVGTDDERSAMRAYLKKADAQNERRAKNGEKPVAVTPPPGADAVHLQARFDNLPAMHRAMAESEVLRASRALSSLAVPDADILKRFGFDAEPEDDQEKADTAGE